MASLPTSRPARPSTSRKEIERWYASLAETSDAELLGVRAGSASAELRGAYVKIARRFHPDALAAADADLRDKQQAVFIRVTQALNNLGGDGPDRPSAEQTLKPAVAAPPAGKPALEEAAALAPAAAPKQATPPTLGPALVVLAPPPVPAPVPAPEAKERPAAERIEQAIEDAELLIDRHEVEAAVGALHEVVSLAQGPKQLKIRLLLARAYLADVRWRRYGVSLLRTLAQEDPANPDALTELGRLYCAEGLLARAETTLARALASDPNHRAARTAMREVRTALERRRESPSPGRAPGLVSRLLPFRR